MNRADRFELMYARHATRVIEYLSRRVNHDRVEDLASEVFTVAWRKLDKVAPGEELPWLYKIAGNHVRNEYRRQRRDSAALVPFESLIDSVVNPDSGANLRLAVIGALGTLSVEDRNIIYLVAYEQLSSDELAKALGRSPEASRKALSRARARLATALSQQGKHPA